MRTPPGNVAFKRASRPQQWSSLLTDASRRRRPCRADAPPAILATQTSVGERRTLLGLPRRSLDLGLVDADQPSYPREAPAPRETNRVVTLSWRRLRYSLLPLSVGHASGEAE